jgi:hypothetical protein
MSNEGRCRERLRGTFCSLAADCFHEVHVAIDEQGVLIARWRMEAIELPLAEGLPRKVNQKFL